MDFRPTDEQAQLRSEVRDFIANDPAIASRPYPEDGWISGYDSAFSRRLAECDPPVEVRARGLGASVSDLVWGLDPAHRLPHGLLDLDSACLWL